LSLRRTLQRRWKGVDVERKIVSYEKFFGIDLVDDNTNLPKGLVPYAEGANFGKEVGAVTKYGKPLPIFTSLGSGGCDGAGVVNLEDGQHLLLAHNGNVYDCKGGVNDIIVDTTEDWNAGSGTARVSDGKLLLPDPAAPTFTRNSAAYKSDGTQVAADQPRFEKVLF